MAGLQFRVSPEVLWICVGGTFLLVLGTCSWLLAVSSGVHRLPQFQHKAPRRCFSGSLVITFSILLCLCLCLHTLTSAFSVVVMSPRKLGFWAPYFLYTNNCASTNSYSRMPLWKLIHIHLSMFSILLHALTSAMCVVKGCHVAPKTSMPGALLCGYNAFVF